MNEQEKRDFFALTDEQKATLLEKLAGGHSRDAAAKSVGVRPSTLCAWIRRGNGKHPDNPYRKFLGKVIKAESECQLWLENVVIESARTKVGDAKWLLQHRHGLSDRISMTMEARYELDNLKIRQAEESLKLTQARADLIKQKGAEITPKMWVTMFNAIGTTDEDDLQN